MLNLKFLDADHDNSRLYYKAQAGVIYCFQETEVRGQFECFECTQSGEPLVEVSPGISQIDKAIDDTGQADSMSGRFNAAIDSIA